MVLRCGPPLWSPAVVPRCGLPLWYPALVPRRGPPMWSPVVVIVDIVYLLYVVDAVVLYLTDKKTLCTQDPHLCRGLCRLFNKMIVQAFVPGATAKACAGFVPGLVQAYYYVYSY